MRVVIWKVKKINDGKFRNFGFLIYFNGRKKKMCYIFRRKFYF